MTVGLTDLRGRSRHEGRQLGLWDVPEILRGFVRPQWPTTKRVPFGPVEKVGFPNLYLRADRRGWDLPFFWQSLDCWTKARLRAFRVVGLISQVGLKQTWLDTSVWLCVDNQMGGLCKL